MNRICTNRVGTIVLFCLLTLAFVPLTAKGEDVSISVEFYPNNVVTGAPVSVTLKGKIYTGSSWFDELAKIPGAFSPDEIFITNYVAANANGTASDIISSWEPDEKESISVKVSDSQMFTKNQTYFKRLTGSAFLARILYGEFSIFLVQHVAGQDNTDIHAYPVRMVAGKYYMTNKLSSDPVFLYIVQKYKNTLSLKTR
ncbi:MAG: hypothetical protein ACOYL3_18525 [Desulfuromonadaceae bacterium]